MEDKRARFVDYEYVEGTNDGLFCLTDTGWFFGELLSAPRSSVDVLANREECYDRHGVYLLLSSDRVYVGQAANLSQRIKQQFKAKKWWERVIVLTASGDLLDHTGIDCLESELISRAKKNSNWQCDNKNRGNKKYAKKE